MCTGFQLFTASKGKANGILADFKGIHPSVDTTVYAVLGKRFLDGFRHLGIFDGQNAGQHLDKGYLGTEGV